MNLIEIYNKWEKKRDEQILSLLNFNHSAKVVDLGCGDGTFSAKVKKQVGCDRMYGVEVWDAAIKKAREKKLDVINSDLNKKLPFEDESFDIVVSNQVLEHLWYPIQFIKEVKRILKTGGIAVISTENLSSWDNIATLILGWTPFSMQFDGFQKIGNPWSPHNNEKLDEYPPHMRIFTYCGLKSALEQIGFKVDSIKGSGNIPFNLMSSIDPYHSRFLTVKVRK